MENIDKQFTETIAHVEYETDMDNQGHKFIRRHDLTPLIRLTIAYTAIIAMIEKQRGVITKLSRDFLISRTFVYIICLQAP